MNFISFRNFVQSFKEYILFKYFKIISQKISYNQNEIFKQGYYRRKQVKISLCLNVCLKTLRKVLL